MQQKLPDFTAKMYFFFLVSNFLQKKPLMPITDANDANAAELLAQNDKAVIKFYASWCGSCRLFAPKYKRLSNDEKYAGIAFLDINAEENPEIRQKIGVSNLPFFAVFKDGKLLESVSTSKEEVFVELLSKLT
jgi:thiol-disulfide isomerase/thioredoxin